MDDEEEEKEEEEEKGNACDWPRPLDSTDPPPGHNNPDEEEKVEARTPSPQLEAHEAPGTALFQHSLHESF